MQSLRMNINHQPNINPTQPGSHCQGHVLHQHVRVLENVDPASKNPPSVFLLQRFHWFSLQKNSFIFWMFFCLAAETELPSRTLLNSEMMNQLDGSSRGGKASMVSGALCFITLMFSSTTSSSKKRLYIIHYANPLLINQSFIFFLLSSAFFSYSFALLSPKTRDRQLPITPRKTNMESENIHSWKRMEKAKHRPKTHPMF